METGPGIRIAVNPMSRDDTRKQDFVADATS
jgi:hypothetical protein